MLAPAQPTGPPAPALPGHEHLLPIAAAARDLRRVRRCERLAGTSGILTLAAGLLGLPFTLGSGVGMALCVALCVLGWREITLRKDLRELDPLGGVRLARNQIALGAVLSGYAIVQLIRGPGSVPGLQSRELAQIPELASTAEGVVRLAHSAIYAGLILGAVFIQGSQSLYYARVGAALRRTYARHPMWVMRIHRAAWAGTVGHEPSITGSAPTPIHQAAA